ncbi:MAG: lysostaphin resistance A-like protein [Candidatus Bathyarchaeia archaeon]
MTNVLALALISAAVIMVAWKNFSFPASQTSIVALLSISGFFALYLPLQHFVGYTYTLLIISAVLFTIVGLIASHVPKRTREARPTAHSTEKGSSHTKTEALPCSGIRKIWGNPLILVPITLLVLVEELLLNSTYAGLGLSLALMALISLPLSAAVLSKGDVRVRRFLEVSALIFANRVVLSAFPIKFLAAPSLLPAIYTLVLIACILYVAYRGIDLNYVGLVRGETSILYQVLAGLLTGYVLGFVEYFVLRPTPITTLSLIRSLVYLVAVMMVFVGITEEFLFRGLLQRSLEDMLPPWQAITTASLIFALMHLGWLNPIEIVFAYTAGVIFGLMFHKTRSLIAPIVAHGFGNVVLYAIVLFF